MNAALPLKRIFTTSDDLQPTDGNTTSMDGSTNLDEFYSSGPAELYAHNRWRPMTYYRFETVAKAIRYFMEELPVRALGSAVIEVDGEERLDRREIRGLYENTSYPLPRRRQKKEDFGPISLAS